MIKEITVKVKTTNKNIGYYKNINSSINSGEVIDINVSQLSKGSKQIITAVCDVCGKEKEMSYKIYYYIVNKDLHNKYYCNNCKGEKIKETCLDKYGVCNVFQLEDTKEKSRETCLEKYGNDYYQQTEEYKNKCKSTSMKKYGTQYPMQNITISKKTAMKNSKNRDVAVLKMVETKNKIYSEKFFPIVSMIHNNKYDYSKSVYINMDTKIEIGCPFHGVFQQRPKDHLHNKQGCPKCNTSKGEMEISKLLEDKGFVFETQKIFIECKNKRFLPFDFYIPLYNICIEYDGEQHYKAYDVFGGDEKLEKRIYLDNIKSEFCKNKGIKLVRIKWDENIKEKLEFLWD